MTLRTLGLLTATLVAPALCAQSTLHVGLQAGLDFPQGDLKNAVANQTGFHAGAHVFLDFQGGHVLRPRLDYTSFPSSSLGVSTEVHSLSLGLDYLYFVKHRAQGIYVTGGLALIQWNGNNFIYHYSAFGTSDKHATSMGWTAGLGYQFNRSMGAEVRYQTSSVWSSTYDSLQAGLTLHF